MQNGVYCLKNLIDVKYFLKDFASKRTRKISLILNHNEINNTRHEYKQAKKSQQADRIPEKVFESKKNSALIFSAFLTLGWRWEMGQ